MVTERRLDLSKPVQPYHKDSSIAGKLPNANQQDTYPETNL